MDCDGSGEILASGIQYAPGHSGPYARMIPCFRCCGEKTVPVEMLQWIEAGRSLRNYRQDRRIGLLEAAKLAGIKASELSAIESGRKPNLREVTQIRYLLLKAKA